MKNNISRRNFIKAGAILGTGAILFPSVIFNGYQQAAGFVSEAKIRERSSLPPHILQILGYALMAPSGHNTQPWKISYQDDTIRLYPDFSRRLPVVDPDDRELWISIGCIAETVITASSALGYDTESDFDPRMNCVSIRITGRNDGDYRFISYIKSRQCTRNIYDGKSIPADQLSLLGSSQPDPDSKISFLTEKQKINELISLTAEATKIQYENSAFMDELKFWIRFSKAEAEEKMDGLYSAASGNPESPRWLGKLFMNLFFSYEDQIKNDSDQISSSPALFLISTKGDGISDWISAGRAYMKFSLLSTEMNIKSAFHNQAIEVESTRPKISEIFGLKKNECPQLLLRTGYSNRMPDSPVRKIEDVLV